MISVNNKRLVDIDYSSLHPNIASSLYGGSGSNINHDKVSSYLSIDRTKAKIENLSFFNKTVRDMKKSPLFKYYSDNEPVMLSNIIKDKEINGHKVTSKKLFKAEVLLMTKVIEQLNENGAFALYVYDALMVEPQHVNLVTYLMNDTASKMNINTTV